MVLIHHSVLHCSLHALCRLHREEPLVHMQPGAVHHHLRGLGMVHMLWRSPDHGLP